VPASDFFLGPFLTALAEGELVTAIHVPAPAQGSGSAYASVEHPASGFALAGAAALVAPDGSSTVAVTGLGRRPFLLEGGDDAALASAEVFGDAFAPGEYRRELARVVVRRALERARRRAEEGAA
jgi:carbon-monoxide dehydrogenase medium subunit